MTGPDHRPRVFSAMSSRRSTAPHSSHYARSTRGAVRVQTGIGHSSLLAHNFNLLWATALNWAAGDNADLFLLHHDDVEPLEAGWLDLMVSEMRRVNAAVLSAVVPIKDDRGLTSTAVETGDVWAPRKLSLAECWALPPTFCTDDLPAGFGGGRLLVNTGLMLVDLTRPEFYELGEGDCLKIYFTIRDRVVQLPEGFVPCVAPEDWNFSRMCHDAGLPVYATTKVRVLHHGDNAWASYPPEAAAVNGVAKEAAHA